jgi:hypothetical protein
MTRTAVIRRLRYLRNGELFNVIFLPGVLAFALWTLQAPTFLISGYTMGLICYILIQGGLYWHLKLAIATGRAAGLPDWFARRYTAFRCSNVVLLGLYPLLAAGALLTGVSRGGEILWATLLAAFAGLEHVNYYHRQLMYDNARDLRWLVQHRRLRPAHLGEDLRAATHPT